MPRYLQDEVHTDFSTGSAVWSGYHDQITGGYLTSGASGGYVDWDNHLMREYNRKIDTFSGAWGAAQAEDLILNPHDAGFRYGGTGYFKWDQYSVDFDGVDDYVDLVPTVYSTGAFTISAWVNSSNGSAGYENIVGGDITRNIDYFSLNSSEKLVYYDFGGSSWRISNTSLTTGTWHHIALECNGSTARFYLDGTIDSADLGWDGTADQKKCEFSELGRVAAVHGREWGGNIDEVAVWDSVLSAAQIAAIYNDGTPQSLADLEPIAWWRMGDGDTYPTLQDSSANNVTGTMTNMTSADIVADTP